MTQSKLKAGDKVKTAGGLDGEIVQVNSAGTAALVNAGKDKTFESSWYSVDSLKKAGGRTKKPDETYLVTYENADGDEVTIDVSADSEDAAETKFGDLAGEGEKFVRVEKAAS
ncbi:hypothetical protein [Aeromicrobium sp. 9AM]|uniref:hypothetical protein n=1 Tax=Aeromicrobium sp. 9AM TaxID=2653126 RepID=UPI0012F468C9|nr:hypothetical protein [Aeromicrobium sp. 9AM]VXC20861.1 hypothetical protein AERO9AM_50363 [Aeromicrobium sp. 9AM]